MGGGLGVKDIIFVTGYFTGSFPLEKSDKSCQNQLKHQNCQKITPRSSTPYTATGATALFSPSSHHPLATLEIVAC